uniref:NADH dehydrogenase subunit 3 n=1 Tax=Bargmannia lata TaxID=2078594 RepID=UPI0026E43C63|nr:NADH dehydrogenase subunit 3 [Bargmannia lata]WJJ70056.1 NADH dehydrogenase subunit 3 [Bargmannia lata]
MNLELQIFLIYIVISFLFSFVLSFLSLILSEKNPYKEKVTSYECGFNPIHINVSFSIRFFLIAILFLVFDIEIFLLFPWSVSTNLIKRKGQIIIILFIIVLVLGLIYEWKQGGLEWE